jgi:hypothetical protein
LRDNEGVNLLFNLLLKTDHIVLMMIVLDRDVEVHHHVPHTKAENVWLYVWVNLAVIQPFVVIIRPAEYQGIGAQIITDPPPCFTVGTRHSGLKASLGIHQI